MFKFVGYLLCKNKLDALKSSFLSIRCTSLELCSLKRFKIKSLKNYFCYAGAPKIYISTKSSNRPSWNIISFGALS